MTLIRPTTSHAMYRCIQFPHALWSPWPIQRFLHGGPWSSCPALAKWASHCRWTSKTWWAAPIPVGRSWAVPTCCYASARYRPSSRPQFSCPCCSSKGRSRGSINCCWSTRNYNQFSNRYNIWRDSLVLRWRNLLLCRLWSQSLRRTVNSFH